MKKEIIRDRAGWNIGQRDTYPENPARITMRDKAGKVVAYYDARNNLTRDRAGRFVGRGDQTIGFLKTASSVADGGVSTFRQFCRKHNIV